MYFAAKTQENHSTTLSYLSIPVPLILSPFFTGRLSIPSFFLIFLFTLSSLPPSLYYQLSLFLFLCRYTLCRFCFRNGFILLQLLTSLRLPLLSFLTPLTLSFLPDPSMPSTLTSIRSHLYFLSLPQFSTAPDSHTFNRFPHVLTLRYRKRKSHIHLYI